jgi:hypothetical protein
MMRKFIHDHEEWGAPSTHWMGGWWAVTNLEAVEYRQIFFPCRETNPEQQPLVRRYTGAIPALKKFKGVVTKLIHLIITKRLYRAGYFIVNTSTCFLQMIVWN